MPKEIIQFDQAMFGSKLDAMVREKVERIVNAMPDVSGGRDRQRRQIRAFRRTEGIPGRPLRAEPDRQGRQARAQGAEIEGRPVRVRGDRTLPQTRGKRREGADRHVPGRRVDNVRILAHFRISALMDMNMARTGYDFQSPTQENRDWKEARSHVQGNHTVRPGHVRDQARHHGAREGRADRQRDARRFRRTRSPTPPDTSALGSGRHTGPATTNASSQPKPADSL